MGGGDNMLIISSILDETGFEKGSKRLMNAIKSLSNSVKSIGVSTQKSLAGAVSSAKRLVPLLVGVGSAYGVLSKAVNAFMSENQQLSSQMSSIWTALGNVLGPIITQFVTWITTAVSYLIELLRLLGLTTKTASEASKSAKGAGGALQKTVAGFDELNKLSEGGGGGGGAGLKDPENLPKWLAMLAEALKSKLWDDAANIIINKFNELIHTFAENAEKFGQKIGEYLGGALHIIARTIDEVNWHELGQGRANFFNGLMENVDGKDLGKILVGAITMAFKIVTGFLENLDGEKLGKLFTRIVTGALNSLTTAIEKADFHKIGENIRKFFENIDWDAIKLALKDLLKAAWEGAVDFLAGLLNMDRDDVIVTFKLLAIAIGLVATAISTVKFASFVGGIINHTSAIGKLIEAFQLAAGGAGTFGEALIACFGSGGAVAGASGAASGLATTLAGLSAAFPIVAGAAAMTGVVLLDNKLSNEYAKKAYDETGGSVEALAAKMNDLAEMASHEEQIIWETAAGIDNFGYSAQEARYAGEAYNELLAMLAESLDITTMELKEQIEAAGGDVTKIDALVNANKNLVESSIETQDALSGTAEQTAETAKALDSAAEDIEDGVNVIDDLMKQWAEAADKATSDISTSTDKNISQAADSATGESEKMTSEVSGDFEEMNSEVQGKMNDLTGIVQNGFANAVAGAHSWGSDLIYNFTNGMAAAFPYLQQGMEVVAQIVRSYLGFSEPEKGPLSNFHTFAPDMMKLYAQGIEQNSNEVLGAVSDLAGGISDAMKAGSYNLGLSTDSFVPSIPDVPFTMPMMAGGGVLPYGIGGSGWGGENEPNAELIEAVDNLRVMIGDLQYALEHMQWIAQFGNVRAVVQEITKVQKQMERANG